MDQDLLKVAFDGIGTMVVGGIGAQLAGRRSRRLRDAGDLILKRTGLTAEQLLERLWSREDIEEIVQQVLAAVAISGSPDHRQALTSVAIYGLQPDADVQLAGLVGRILADLHPIEVHALRVMANEPEANPSRNAEVWGQLFALPVPDSHVAVLSRLNGKGLVFFDGLVSWYITPFGRGLLSVLRYSGC